MVQDYRYRSPTTPGNPGWDDDLGNTAVRLGSIQGITQEAELGAVGISSIVIDDPTGTAGHNGDAIVGLKQFDWIESAPGAGNRRIWTGYIGDRKYRRGNSSESPSLRTGAARVIDITLVDINSFLSFRVFTPEVTFNRPAETDVARVTALLATSLLSTTLFNGLVSTANPVNMDAVDYAGQRPSDVLNDCAQQSGKNFFVFYDEAGTYTPAAGDFALFYDFNSSSVYLSTMQVSNVLADFDNSTTFYPFIADGELVRDPSRVVAGVLVQNGSNSVYEKLLSTSYKYGYRDAVAPSQNLKTVAQIKARADRYLAENASEDDRLTFTTRVPAAHVNDWKVGQAAQVKFTHLPGYSSWRYVRALTRTTRQNVEDDTYYDIHYECTPVTSTPSGAFDSYYSGDATGNVPTLKNVTIPGDLLLLIVSTQEIAAVSTALAPTFDGTGTLHGWTQHAWVSAQDLTAAIGPPGAVGFGIYSRLVAPAESTKTPVSIELPNGAASSHVWLYEIPGATAPVLVTTKTTDGGTPYSKGTTFTIGTALAGRIVGGGVVGLVDYGDRPTMTTVAGTQVTNADGINNPAMPGCGNHGWKLPWTWLGQTADGSIPLAFAWTQPCDPSYDHEGACGATVVVPGLTQDLPTIPYPANQV